MEALDLEVAEIRELLRSLEQRQMQAVANSHSSLAVALNSVRVTTLELERRLNDRAVTMRT